MDPFEKHTSDVSGQLAPALGNLKRVAKYGTIYHLLLIPIIIFLGNIIVGLIDRLGTMMGLRVIDTGSNDFWMVPIVAFLFVLAFCTGRVWHNPRRSDWMQPVLMVHGILTVSYFLYYYIDINSLAYLLAGILELLLFLVFGYFYWRGRSAGSAVVSDEPLISASGSPAVDKSLEE